MTVCVGNICRSPVAEGILKQAFPEKTIFSSGLGALVGHPADETAAEIALSDGIDISSHRAQQLTSYLCKQADLILVMEEAHKKEIERLHPFTKGRVHCLGIIEKKTSDIKDPYKKNREFFEKTHKKIKENVAEWIGLIKKIS